MIDEEAIELDDDTITAINRAEEQFARGEGIDFDQFAAEARKKYAVRYIQGDNEGQLSSI